MAPETSTQTDTRGEAVSPVTSTATSAPPLPHHEQHQHQHQQPPVQEHFAPAMPSTAHHVDHRGSAAIPQQPHQPYVLYPASYGEHYVPYEQSRQADMLRQGHAQGAQVVAPRIIVPETKSWRMTKDVLHVLAMVMSIAGIGIGISLASNSYSGLMGTLVSVPIFGVALIWSLAEMITRATTHWGPGIHPGAHVGMCLILWIAAVIAGGCCATVVAIADDDCESTYRSSRYYDDNCFYGRTRGRFLGLAILLIGLFVAEFILFVGGCIDTNKRNKARSNAPVMIVAQPGMYPHAMMQQQPQQQQPQQPMTQQYFAPQHAYHPQQFSAMPPHAQAPAHARAMPEGSERTREKQPEGTQPAITEFYSPAGPGHAV